jgi:hypothetical protein
MSLSELYMKQILNKIGNIEEYQNKKIINRIKNK